jgi:succinate-semialdehyde dehydrogenase/glutarate-semialdehyde dehydrogenase
MTRFSLQDPDLFRRQAYIGGQWCDADNGATLEVNNPATGEILGTVPMMGTAETRRAIDAAKNAWGDWRRKPAKDRSALLRKWHELMLANIEDLGKLMTAEQGKPLAEAKGEVAYAASFIEWFAEEAKRVYGDTIPSPWSDRRLVVIKEPIGVCAALTPWNFPAAMITRKAGPALAAGCTMVAKPASSTPFSALALAALAERAGIPGGVFSVLQAARDRRRDDIKSRCAKVTFTGSTEVGRSS